MQTTAIAKHSSPKPRAGLPPADDTTRDSESTGIYAVSTVAMTSEGVAQEPAEVTAIDAKGDVPHSAAQVVSEHVALEAPRPATFDASHVEDTVSHSAEEEANDKEISIDTQVNLREKSTSEATMECLPGGGAAISDGLPEEDQSVHIPIPEVPPPTPISVNDVRRTSVGGHRGGSTGVNRRKGLKIPCCHFL